MTEVAGLIGAGMMGSGIARNLKLAGYPVQVYKRRLREDDEAVRECRSLDIPVTTDMQELFSTCELLLTCLPDSPTVESVITGEEGLLSCRERKVKRVIDFTTAHPESTKAIAEKLARHDISLLDAPMTGGPQQAHEGELGLAVGGSRELFDRYTPLFGIISRHFSYAGPQGSGNVLKLINNFLGIMNNCAGAAAYSLIEGTEIDPDAFYRFISNSGGNSSGFQAVMTRIMKQEFPMGFALGLAHKDLTYMKDLFERAGGFPIFSGTYEVMNRAVEEGFGDRDLREVYFSIKKHLGTMG